MEKKNSIRFDVFLRSIHHRLDILVVWVVDVRRLEDCHILRQEDQLSVNTDRAINRWHSNIQHRPSQHTCTVSGLCRPTGETPFEWRFADGPACTLLLGKAYILNLYITFKPMLDNIVLVNHNNDRDIYRPQNVMYPHFSGELEIDLALEICSYQFKAGPILQCTKSLTLVLLSWMQSRTNGGLFVSIFVVLRPCRTCIKVGPPEAMSLYRGRPSGGHVVSMSTQWWPHRINVYPMVAVSYRWRSAAKGHVVSTVVISYRCQSDDDLIVTMHVQY